MKTIKQIDNEIIDIIQDCKENDYNDTFSRKMGRRVSFLYQCKLYLEYKPNKGFLTRQVEELEARLSIIKNGFSKWNENQPTMNNPENKYNTIMGTRKVREQVRTLKFILS